MHLPGIISGNSRKARILHKYSLNNNDANTTVKVVVTAVVKVVKSRKSSLLTTK